MQKKLLYIALRLDLTGDGASIYAMNNVLSFASQIPTDLITLQAPQTTEGYRQLQSLDVNLIAVSEEAYNRQAARKLLLKRGHNIFRESVNLRQAVLKQIQKETYSFVVLELYTAYLMADIRALLPGCKIVLSQHNYEYANHREYSQYRIKSPLKRVLYRLLNHRYQAIEHQCLRNADAVIAISTQDQQRFSAIRNTGKHTYVMAPVLLFDQQKQIYRSTCTNILFLGMMDWYPNIQGLTQFIEQVFYPLLANGQSYHLYVVGKKPVPEVRKFQSEYITITGEVPSVDDYIRLCDLMVVPNTLGGGVKIKVMEALQKGIPLLIHQASAVGYEGIADYFVVKDYQDFIRRIGAYPQEITVYPSKLAEAKVALVDRSVQNRRIASQIIAALTSQENIINTY